MCFRMKTVRVSRGAMSRLAAFTAVALIVSHPSTIGVSASGTTAVITGLDGPRGVTIGPADRVVFAEIDGSFSKLLTRGRHAGTLTDLGSVPPTYIAPALTMNGAGETFILTASGPGSGAATLYRWNPGARGARIIADIAAYQVSDPDPYNVDSFPPEESNPFGVAVLPDGSALVSDAAANDLLRVYPDGTIVTVARLKPRIIVPPAELGGGPAVPSEAVATSVTVGADGYYYVGELRGAPATPGTSQVWRIAPDSVDVVCDPAAPTTGSCQRYADGFTSIVALGADRDGGIYVVELVKQSWLQWELDLVEPLGGLFRIPPGGGPAIELAAGQLVLPGGVAVARSGTVYVTAPVFGPGMLARIQ